MLVAMLSITKVIPREGSGMSGFSPSLRRPPESYVRPRKPATRMPPNGPRGDVCDHGLTRQPTQQGHPPLKQTEMKKQPEGGAQTHSSASSPHARMRLAKQSMAKPTAIRRMVQKGMIFLQGEDYNMRQENQNPARVSGEGWEFDDPRCLW